MDTESDKQVSTVEEEPIYRMNDCRNELKRCYETSRIRINTDFMCELVKFAIIGAILLVVGIFISQLIAGAVSGFVGAFASVGIIIIVVLILIYWLYTIMSSVKKQRIDLDADEETALEES